MSNFKKSISVILGSLLISTSIINVPINAQDDTVDYVAFGDSIAYGYGLNDVNDGFVNIVGEYLNSDVSNYAVSGLTSTQLVEMLESGDYDDDIINADVITLTIGSNDILLPFMNLLYTSLNLEGNPDTALKDWYDNTDIFTKLMALNSINVAISNDTTLDEACENFETNTFPTIISDIKELNPDCEIIVTEFYNPYYSVNIGGVFNLGAMSDKYIQELNSVLYSTSATDYKVAKIYNSFNTIGLTNVDSETLNMDPHPNVDGHRVIADAVIEQLDTQLYIGDSEDTNIIGDVNIDGKVNILDLLFLKKHTLGLDSNLDTTKFNFDVNSDNTINGNDIITLKKIILGLDI